MLLFVMLAGYRAMRSNSRLHTLPPEYAMSNLPFFVPSLPDETIQSRVARHHVLSGNRLETDTFLDLFDSAPFALEQIVPPGLARLADRLADDPDAAMQGLLERNTLLPLFAPFLGGESRSGLTGVEAMMGRLPRRVVGLHGEAQLCTVCVAEDVRAHGMAHWRRAHHIPGVSVCWRHGTPLLSSCPCCHRPFQFANRLLRLPWRACRCGWQASGADATSVAVTSTMLHYARFASDLLNRPLGRLESPRLRAAYLYRIRELGFTWGANVQMKAFENHLIEELGDTFLAAVDPAFAAKRMSFWIRFTPRGSSECDMPVTRHLLLAMHLFGTRDQFERSLQRIPADEPLIPTTRSMVGGADQPDEAVPASPRAAHRRRIRDEIVRNPKTTIEDLWRKAYRITSWLYDHDRSWLLATLSLPYAATPPGTSTAIKVSTEDERFAAHVDATAAALLSQDGKPQQVTKERLLAALPLRVADTPAYRERFPGTLARVTENREPTWHFRARRVWWAYGVLGARGDPLLAREASVLSGVGYNAVRAIVEHCSWASLLSCTAQFDVLQRLAESGITQKWDGPPAWRGRAIGGRAYQREISEL
ncbi:TnsD family Tn7-like transposition protein [Paraburkholderia sediminicola]|uniref:TnsD family Tn7-like transposition protein n=1 Tax=Paraburkholderia sediminicola TaxID=458836 RepID=UPI0038BB19AC